MIQRLLGSRLARWAFVLVAVGLATYALATYWDQVREAAVDLDPVALVAALALAVVGTGFSMLSWRRVLSDLGSPLPLSAATRVFSLAQLGKYIPGSIWPFVAQVELGREHGVPRQRSAVVGLLAVIISLTTALLVAAVTLPLVARDAAARYWWALALVPVLLVCLHPRVLNPVLDRVLRLARRPALEHRLTLAGVLGAVAWGAASWMVFGLHVWLLARDLGADGDGLVLASIGSFALAWSIGFVVVIAPAGAGVRELVLAVGLASSLGRGPVILLVIASRLIMTLADLAWAGLGLVLGRAAARPEDFAAASVLREHPDTDPLAERG